MLDKAGRLTQMRDLHVISIGFRHWAKSLTQKRTHAFGEKQESAFVQRFWKRRIQFLGEGKTSS